MASHLSDVMVRFDIWLCQEGWPIAPWTHGGQLVLLARGQWRSTHDGNRIWHIFAAIHSFNQVLVIIAFDIINTQLFSGRHDGTGYLGLMSLPQDLRRRESTGTHVSESVSRYKNCV
jgi:hypothetical protein